MLPSTLYIMHVMHAATKFEVAASNGLIYKKRDGPQMHGETHGRTDDRPTLVRN